MREVMVGLTPRLAPSDGLDTITSEGSLDEVAAVGRETPVGSRDDFIVFKKFQVLLSTTYALIGALNKIFTIHMESHAKFQILVRALPHPHSRCIYTTYYTSST